MNVDQLWAQLAVATCVRLGIDQFFLAPGSRCTPLTLAVARHPDVQVHQHFDERALAFAALGYGRATGIPGVFICTSGTAAANALPAVVEASSDNIPLVLMTADRPPELRDVGANQAIDQVHLFGRYARWFVDMPCPTTEITPRFVQGQVHHALTKAMHGPAHLNWMFREPFGVANETLDVEPLGSPDTLTLQTDQQTICIPARDALMVIGDCRPSEARSAMRLAEEAGVFVLSDLTSGMCCGSPELPLQFRLPAPQTIIHVGGRIVSKAWSRYVEKLDDVAVVRLSNVPSRIDPYHRNVQDLTTPLSMLHETVTFGIESSERQSEFQQAWQVAHDRRQACVAEQFRQLSESLTEPVVVRALCDRIPDLSGLFVGNSTPIRDLNWFAHWDQTKRIHVGANRGASGIDGLLATAYGYATGLGLPTTVLLGDLAALHDLNSLALLKSSTIPLVVVLLNNHGGGIFDLLPISNQSEHFERFFATPHEFDFEHAARMFGLRYDRPRTMDEFNAAYSQALDGSTSTLLEVQTERTENSRVRKQINAAIQ